MNKNRRKEIARAAALLDEAKVIIEGAQSEEQDYYDSMPESLQSGEKGSAAELATEALQEAADGIDEVVAACQRAVE